MSFFVFHLFLLQLVYWGKELFICTTLHTVFSSRYSDSTRTIYSLLTNELDKTYIIVARDSFQAYASWPLMDPLQNQPMSPSYTLFPSSTHYCTKYSRLFHLNQLHTFTRPIPSLTRSFLNLLWLACDKNPEILYSNYHNTIA